MARHLIHDRHGTQPAERDRHRMGAHAVARNATSRMGRSEADRRVTLLADLDAFSLEHEYCGDLDSAVESDSRL
jgi:hypothetical protein